MNNIIINNIGDAIGYYSDLVKALKEQAKHAIECNDWESTELNISNLEMLDDFTDSDGLLVLSENNGMGWTIKRYKDYEEI